MELIPTNEYQTKVTEALIKSLDERVGEELLTILDEVPFVKSLISPKRGRACDRPRDDRGRIIVDISNPHILENMDYFREVAIHYNNTGELTSLKPSNDPGSPYFKWLKRELDRIWNGMVRPSDGEWITGYMYWYLNYCPIMLSRVVEGTKRADRVEAMPEVWEGVYWRFHYIDQAAALGKHCAELAARGRGKSYTLASILSHLFLVGDNQKARRGVTGIVTASNTEYLIKDGTLTKFVRMIDFCSSKTQFPKQRLKNSVQDMTWVSGYKEVGSDSERGSLNTVIGVTANDSISKIRGKRAAKILIEEMGCHLRGTKVLLYDGSVKKVESVKVGDLLMGDNGTPRMVKELFHGFDKKMYRLKLINGDEQIVNSSHPVRYMKLVSRGHFEEQLLPSKLLARENRTNFDRYGTRKFFIEKAKISLVERECKTDPYREGMKYGDRKLWKDRFITCIPDEYKLNSNEIQLEFIAGLLDMITPGAFYRKSDYRFYSICFSERAVEDLKFMCECNGLRFAEIASTSSSCYNIRGDLSIIPTRARRNERPSCPYTAAGNPWNYYPFEIEEYGYGEYYGFTVTGNHLFCLADLQITHNTFPKFLNLYNVLLPSVQEGDIAFGQIYALGTAGDSESDFSGAREILCNPDGYNMYSIKNVYDKAGKGRSKFTFFFPGYVNRKGCYNKDGVSDVVKALIEILVNRHNVRRGSTDPASIMRTISEVPITPDEAMMRNEGNMFPVADCTARIAALDSDPNAYDNIYVGELKFDTKGEVVFSPTTDLPIRDYPLKDNKHTGAIEIYEMPQRGDDKKVHPGRYISGLDPYSTDQGVSDSLGSIFVLDLWTDRIVAEYTGRTMYVDDFNEVCRKLCLFYNARLNYENNIKGVFSYFSAHNSTYLLTETLEFLKDKQLAKPGIGNASRGVTATQAVNSYARNLLRNWLVSPVTVQNPDGTETTVARLFTLKNRALLRELVSYNSDGNFDRISAMGMLMLLREEKIILYQGDIKGGQAQRRNGYLGDDPFFTKNYRR